MSIFREARQSRFFGERKSFLACSRCSRWDESGGFCHLPSTVSREIHDGTTSFFMVDRPGGAQAKVYAVRGVAGFVLLEVIITSLEIGLTQ